MKKKVLIGVLLLIELCSIYLMYKSSNNKEVLDNKEIKEEKKEKFAIMVQDDTGKYNKSSDTTFPSTGYYLNASKSECLDIEGNKIENAVSGSNGNVTLTNKYTSYCTLYFDLMSLGQLCEDQSNMETCMNNKKARIGEVYSMTSVETGGMYCYQGKNYGSYDSDYVNNYICFGTTNKEECTRQGARFPSETNGNPNIPIATSYKYLYRIIGVTPSGELVLVMDEPVWELFSNGSGTGPTFALNNYEKKTDAECGTDGSKCKWPDFRIYQRLNGLCNSGNSNCKGTTSGNSGDTNLFINSLYYDYLYNSKWLNKIEMHNWKYGNIAHEDIGILSSNKVKVAYDKANTIYNIENNFKESVNARIGLMYIHDMLYSLGWAPGMPYVTGNATMTTSLSLANSTYVSFYRVQVDNNTSSAYLYSGIPLESVPILSVPSFIHPVFYLTPSVKISNATGSKTDPFIITN